MSTITDLSPMVDLRGIHKRFAGKSALEPLTLQVARGEICGLLGHNGAGKSTTLGILLGHVRADAGEAFIGGRNIRTQRMEALSQTGAIFETPGFYDYLSGWTNLRILAAYSGFVSRETMEEAVRLVGLEGRIHDKVKTYSHGMRQRLALAQALTPRPKFLLLDEPTEGLDPEGIFEIRTLILRLREHYGLTVLFSSHLLSEVEQICDRIGMLREGKLIYEGCWREEVRKNVYQIVAEEGTLAQDVLLADGVEKLTGDRFVLPDHLNPSDLLAKLVHQGSRICAFSPVPVTLEEFYLEKTGK